MAREFLADLHDITEKTFDYVVVGGGTAGLCVASRLSEDSNVTVAVLEAGKAHPDDPRLLAPGGWVQQLFNPDYDWVFKTVPRSDLNGGRGQFWNRGKGLGGSSAINISAWTRPQREEVDAFEKLGNEGLNWEVFYKYSKKSERFVAPTNPATTGYRDLYNDDAFGHDGPMIISFTKPPGASGAEQVFQESLTQFGIETLNDALSGNVSGSLKSPVTVDPEKGTRTLSSGYLELASGRKNLTILTEAQATRVITSDDTFVGVSAAAVQFYHSGELHEVNVAKEVILCAGTIMDPKILELSGIGDEAILRRFGIPVRVHLPSVGNNVQEHVHLAENIHVMRQDSGVSSMDKLRDSEELTRLLALYPHIHDSLSMIPTSLTFIPLHKFSDRAAELVKAQRAKVEQESQTYPPGLLEQYKVQLELLESETMPSGEIMLVPWALRETGQVTLLFPPKAWSELKKFSALDLTRAYISASAVLCHPFSRGSIHISSADPKAPPTIVPGFLDEKIDEELMLDLFKFSRKVTATDPFKSLTENEVPSTAALITDEEIRNAVGSVSMLPHDKGGVIDTAFKVYGTRNIRVVDASVFPLIPSVHMQASVYAMAELASDVIKGKLVL